MGVVDRLSMEKQALKIELEKAKARGDRYFEQAFEDRQRLYKFMEKWFESKKWYLNRIDSSREILDLFWKLYELVQHVECFRFPTKDGTKAYTVANHPKYKEFVVYCETGDSKFDPVSGKLDLDEAVDLARSLAEQN